MKKIFVSNAAMFALVFFCLSTGTSAFAQRYLTERKPDLVLLAVTVKKEGVDQLNVIWSIQNQGDASAVEFGKLVSFDVEGSNKPNLAGEAHNWVLKNNRFLLNLSKTELKPGEILKGNTLLPYIEQDNLVSYRFTLDFNDDFYELKKENNSFVTQLVGW